MTYQLVRSLFMTLILLMLLSAPASADWLIEREVQMGQQELAFTIAISKTAVRIDDGQMNLSVLYDFPAKTLSTLQHQQKLVMSVSLAQLEQVLAQVDQQAESMIQRSGIKLIKTDEKKTIAGYPCTKTKIESGDGVEREIWLTTAITAPDLLDSYRRFSRLSTAQQAMQSPAMLAAMELMKQGVVLEMVTRQTAKGGQTTRMTTRAITEKDIPKDRFMIPADYKKMAVPGPAPKTDKPAATPPAKPKAAPAK